MLADRRMDNSEVIGYCNSDFIECFDSRKSISGYIFMFSNGTIPRKSTKQTLIVESTMEADFVSCC